MVKLGEKREFTAQLANLAQAMTYRSFAARQHPPAHARHSHRPWAMSAKLRPECAGCYTARKALCLRWMVLPHVFAARSAVYALRSDFATRIDADRRVEPDGAFVAGTVARRGGAGRHGRGTSDVW